MDSGLANQLVVITGASGGIGQALVRAFLAENARVAAHYFRNRPSLDSQAEQQGQVRAFQADLRDESQVEWCWSEIESAMGPASVLVANAGIWVEQDTPIHEMTLAQWNETIASDLTSVFLCARAFFRGIARHRVQSPSLILIGSTAGVFGEAGHADYAAAKAGLVYGMTRTLKNEIVRLAPLGRVNAVCPGWTETPVTAASLADKSLVRRALQTMPLRRVACPEDIAGAVVFLASPVLSSHTSGQILTIAGGMEGRVLHG